MSWHHITHSCGNATRTQISGDNSNTRAWRTGKMAEQDCPDCHARQRDCGCTGQGVAMSCAVCAPAAAGIHYRLLGGDDLFPACSWPTASLPT